MAKADGHDASMLIGEIVPTEAALIDKIVVGFENAALEPVIAHEQPDVLDRVSYGHLGGTGSRVILEACHPA